jgi:DNA-binding HxlR family transcriptional regulator
MEWSVLSHGFTRRDDRVAARRRRFANSSFAKAFHVLRDCQLRMQHGHEVTAATREVLDRLRDKWSARAIAALLRGPLGFVELRRELHGVSHKVLSHVLRSLERDGYFSRHVRARAPLRVEYRLTSLGLAFVQLLGQLEAWSAAHRGEVMAQRRAYDASHPSKSDEPGSTR